MFWLATRMELAGFLSQAGVMRSTHAMGWFWSAVDPADWPTDAAARAEIEQNMEGPFGDRRTEMVIIGREMDQDELLRRFRECELTDAEMAGGEEAWSRLNDPFPSWEQHVHA